MKTLNVTCPICKKKFEYYSSEHRPFCSDRCRLIDLGQWLNESYTVPATKLTPEEIDQLEQIHEEKNQSSEEDDEDHTLN